MKSISFALGFLLITGCAHLSTTSSPVNIDGTWKGELFLDGRNILIDGEQTFINGRICRFTFNFKSDGESLTGNVRDSTAVPDEWIPIENGKIEGNNIYFTTRPSQNVSLQQLTARFKGRVEGDEIILTFNLNWSINKRDRRVGFGTPRGVHLTIKRAK